MDNFWFCAMNAWEKRKLGNFVDEFIEKTTVQNQYPMLTSSQKHGIVLQTDYFSNRQITTSQNVGYFVLPRNYFTYRSRSDNGIFRFNRNEVVDKGIISYFYPVFQIKGGNGDFFLELLNYSIKKQVDLESVGTGQRVLSFKKFKNISAKVPEITEQEMIGHLFKKVRILIAATQQKIDNLEQVKKALLQYLFDQSLRFSGYSIPWEKHKLDDVLSERKTRSSDLPLLSVTINNGVIKADENGRKDNSSSDLSNYKVVRVGDIPYNSMRMWQGASGYSYFEGIVSPAYTVLVPKNQNDGLFWSFCLKRGDMLSLFTRFSQGLTSDTWNLKYPQLSAIQVKAPQKPEQVQISNLLRNADHLITATQSKLFGYQQLKKSLLQRLFV
ncbi:restriction endonuclease subunit S [Lacticaseibacillus chiayiensis]|uniref:restriction endonuclease subunit S n=1 Tax=Lacticaseibacillus chiayiensis TaxID=2100821 RepID=UPI003C723451